MNFLQAAEAVKSAAKQYRHMMEVAEALEAIGSLEQATAEKTAMLAKLDESIEVGRKMASTMMAEAKAQQDAANFNDATARDNVAKLIDAAQANAAEIAKKADEDAAAKLSAARVQADSLVAQAKIMVAQAQADINAKKYESTQLDGDVQAKRDELAALQVKIEAARAQIAKMLGQ